MQTVDELLAANAGLAVEEKNILCDAWIMRFIEIRGKRPTPYDLVKLADWILEGDLKDVSRSKVQNNEFPILSKPQIERRYRELSLEVEIVDVLHQKRMFNQPTRKKDSKNNEY